ncbi:MAG: bifunctional N(6)-L-threonylcarbamoyladenine synthase/serine/threonine protein kinase [Candidatus Nanoarchaeia archaeon]|nr:bifunctional N(6)-L-threonylcarbamoyladenine synthase/serine/threonine protein kinase [Candidatus Nanoarchaeia archaeon]
MIVLGIESTAHTFSASVMNENEVLSLESKTLTTELGGLIPREIIEHHIANGPEIINKALIAANKKINEIELISFSQSPGIGGALQIGAVIARALSLKNNIPLVGVNHCIAHLEIARMMSGLNDPVMLYTSGANTQIIAFSEGKYRVFGETLDMGVGNFIDHVGRILNIGFPAGKKIEEIALKGKNFIELPYKVKGMDINFGGIYSNIVNKIESKNFNINDLCYSLQETVFAMLVEISERALAHCQKKELVLTGGVGANKRLNEMCEKMCKDRGAIFKSIPIKYSVDNASMIAWTGLLKYKSNGADKIIDTEISQKTRTEEVDIFWRKQSENCNEVLSMPKNQDSDFLNIISMGAEAIIRKINDEELIKDRIKKNYRLEEIDDKLRISRTKIEFSILKKVIQKKILVPKVWDLEKFSFKMQYLKGELIRDYLHNCINKKKLFKIIGKQINLMHENNIVHGDLTTSNMILVKDDVYFIDFSLGGLSGKLEDKAVDLHLIKQALIAKHNDCWKECFDEILSQYKNKEVLNKLKSVEKRGRKKA